MTQEEFEEYKAVVEYALDIIKFNDRVDIIQADTSIYIVMQRDRDIAALITPRGSEFNIMYFDRGLLSVADVVNLAAPDSLIALGALLSNHLKVKYGQSKSSADLR